MGMLEIEASPCHTASLSVECNFADCGCEVKQVLGLVHIFIWKQVSPFVFLYISANILNLVSISSCHNNLFVFIYMFFSDVIFLFNFSVLSLPYYCYFCFTLNKYL